MSIHFSLKAKLRKLPDIWTDSECCKPKAQASIKHEARVLAPALASAPRRNQERRNKIIRSFDEFDVSSCHFASDCTTSQCEIVKPFCMLQCFSCPHSSKKCQPDHGIQNRQHRAPSSKTHVLCQMPKELKKREPGKSEMKTRNEASPGP